MLDTLFPSFEAISRIETCLQAALPSFANHYMIFDKISYVSIKIHMKDTHWNLLIIRLWVN